MTLNFLKVFSHYLLYFTTFDMKNIHHKNKLFRRRTYRFTEKEKRSWFSSFV